MIGANKYAISDIHGCALTFKELLNKISLSKNDELYLLGDFINRGSKSKQVVDYIIELQSQGYNIIALKGNHEEMVFDSIELDGWTAGAKETLKSFNIKHLNQLNPKYIKWFSNLKSLSVNNEFIFVHAGLNFEINNPIEDIRSVCWITDWYKSINYEWLKSRKIIHGHIPKKKYEIKKMLQNFPTTKVLNIDNGCYLKGEAEYGNLCCVELNKMELTFQENID
nr:metallophosphoesterase family protein [uncultured Carboxylicivirga sp.]